MLINGEVKDARWLIGRVRMSLTTIHIHVLCGKSLEGFR